MHRHWQLRLGYHRYVPHAYDDGEAERTIMKPFGKALTSLLAAVVMLLVVAAILILSWGRSAGRATTHGMALEGATRETVTRSVLKWTVEDYGVLSGTPRVVLARDLTLDDLLSLGNCPTPRKNPADPRYVLAVVEGDLDLSNWPGLARSHPNPEDRRFRYIAYVVDTAEARPRILEQHASRNGGGFRQILDEPGLPDDVALNSSPNTPQVDTAIRFEDCPVLTEYERPRSPDKIQPTVAPLDSQE